MDKPKAICTQVTAENISVLWMGVESYDASRSTRYSCGKVERNKIRISLIAREVLVYSRLSDMQ